MTYTTRLPMQRAWKRPIHSLGSSIPAASARSGADHAGYLTRSIPGIRRTSDSTAQPGVTVDIVKRSNNSSIATITISNPRKLNIVNTSILGQLADTADRLAHDEALRAVVLTGGSTASGKAPSFIGGMDISEMHQIAAPREARSTILRIHRVCKALRDIPVPVIARVHGFSLGAGLEIMAACDLRIATRASVFGMPEVKIGIPSVVEAALLPGLIGMGRTRRLLYLAENINGETAERWGLIERLVDDEASLDEVVNEWVAKIAQMGPKAIRSQKRLMQCWENSTVDEGIQAGVEAFANAFEGGGKEPVELMSQFIDRKR